MNHSELDCLRDMLAAALEAREFTATMTYEEFADNKMAVNATIRSMEVLGEACRRLPRAWRDKRPQIPWLSVAGMRDRLIHDYKNVNYRIVWNVARDELPKIMPLLEELIHELEP